ncbi:MAG: endopeptidase La [Deltaproteobacteria bacterium]|nr:endopeptidase La [Deltaproteobacteria bacterium]MBW2121113.1 endopeptidase La [Deltaproteobacteria bacterium]
MIFLPKEEAGKGQRGKDDRISIPNEIPILPLRGTVLYPELILPIMVGRKRSVKLIDDAMERDRIIGVVTQKRSETEDPREDELYRIGVGALILRMIREMDGSQRVIVQGLSRIRIEHYSQRDPYYVARVEVIEESPAQGVEVDALMMNLQNLFQKAVELAPYLTNEMGQMVSNIKSPGILADLIASNLNIPTAEKQNILNTLDVTERLNKVHILLNKEVQVLELGNKIQSQVKEDIDKTQREYYLREQLKAIKKELGEMDEHTAEIKELQERIAKAKMPEEALKAAQKELDRLAKIPPASAEYTVARTYLDWLIDLPWSLSTRDNLDIKNAERILDEDHYDLQKVKKRILEYLAVRKLKSDMKGPILCFAGPPGVGKTSLGKSIARAMDRRFVRISLGGVRDEAEIRGHRRTYVGALPGRIIQGIKKAGSNNPVFMIDEVDKIGMDFRGDPSSALLEVLDPEQNNSFSDHYIDIAFDLSKVMFITTANVLETIPPALRDRMEVLELPGYSEEEKMMIAKNFLIPRQLKEHGLSEDYLEFEDSAISGIINSYTREAGVRNLEREIASVCRGVAKEVAEGRSEKVVVGESMLHRFLGPVKFFPEVAERTAEPGVATGVAWTPTGGDIIFIEATQMRGEKGLTLTGQLGDVMKESAQAALSYVRAKAKELGIKEDFFGKTDIHIHVPAGAIPKDGPSAGVTIFIALTSLLTGRPVRSDVAMTGEITLRGLILPVGGIKEKILAARRAGIKVIILPQKNEKDLEEIPETIKQEMEFKFVSRMDEVIPLVLKDQ